MEKLNILSEKFISNFIFEAYELRLEWDIKEQEENSVLWIPAVPEPRVNTIILIKIIIPLYESETWVVR